jgi:hypothetical protein
MSASTALVRYTPVEPRLLPRTRRIYQAGIVMESLEVRRVLSAAVQAVIEPPADAADGQAIVVEDDGPDQGGCGTADEIPGDGGDVADPTIYETFMVEDGVVDFGEDGGGDDNGGGADWNADDSGVDWPAGWGWSLDRVPTQDEIDAANNGDDLGGLWVPVRYFGGIADDGLATEDASADGQAGGDAGGDVMVEEGEVFDPRLVFANMAGGPGAVNSRGPTASDAGAGANGDGGQGAQAVVGGAPAPVTFGAGLTSDGLVLGKLKSSVTADQGSDLPFLN